jgi:basic membrane protein A
VTSTSGVNDRSFNAFAWSGVQQAMSAFGIEGVYRESVVQADYAPNIDYFIHSGCDLIITVGLLLRDATQAAAEANPTVRFLIVDDAFDPPMPNALGQVYAADEAAFLAGYLAARVTRTGNVGTFGGLQIPHVTAFMDGFALGVQYYNQQHGTSVQVLGWDPASQTGLFAQTFENADEGRRLGESLMDEGADIIMPVAGPVGLGTAAAVTERGNAYIIGSDGDWFFTAPEYADIVLTSVMKYVDAAVLEVIRQVVLGRFAGGAYVGNLENGGVGLAPYHDLAPLVSLPFQAELGKVRLGIIAGEFQTRP